jgi:hypothetical protein
MEPAKPVVMVTDFPGIMMNVDPRDFPDGASEDQVNACSLKVGELNVRNGIRAVVFED